MTEFRMPSLGADMEAGTLVEWLVKPGDRVKRGDIVAVVETEKADIDVEIFTDGVVDELVIPEGERVPVGTVLAMIRTDHEAPAGQAVEPRVSPVIRQVARRLGVDLAAISGTGADGAITRADVERAAGRRPAPQPPSGPTTKAPLPSGPPTPVPGRPERLRASPLAAAEAQRLGIDLSAVVGTGPGGAVTRADVERLATSVAAPPEAEVTLGPERPKGWALERQLAMRRAIADLMARSKREIPHYYLGTWIDLSTSFDWLETTNRDRPAAERILPAALLLKAVALATREVPEMNGFWVEEEFRPGEGVHVGVAVSLRQGGLIAPCIHDADGKGLDDLMVALRDLVRRARGGQLRSSEMSDPTITVSNLGDQGVETLFGVIYAPQVALVGFGKVVDRPWAQGGLLGVRPMVHATLSADHRASDGHRGGLFLAGVDRFLQGPEAL